MNGNEKIMKCLILGANGFVGMNLCKGLLANRYSVRTFSRHAFNPDFTLEGSKIEEYVGDFLNVGDLRLALKGVDVVFHLISTTLPKSSNDDPVYDVVSNVGGTVKLLELMREAEVSKILFFSSGGTVYGDTGADKIHEDAPTNPICSYGVGKVAIEKYLFMYKELYGIDYINIRLSNPYGVLRKIDKPQGAINSFLTKALCGNTIEIWGDGSVIRDYIYIDDVVAACILALGLDKWNGETLNIGSGQGASLLGIISIIEKITGNSIACDFQPSRCFDVPVNVLDITKAFEVLNWQPKVSLQEGIGRTRDWLVRNLSQLNKS